MSEKLAFLIPSTSKGKNWTCLEDTFFYKFFLPSFLKTKSNKFEYIFYLGFDSDDNLFKDNNFINRLMKLLEKNGLKYFICYFHGAKKGHLTKLWNTLFEKAYDDKCYYFYQCGDDSIRKSRR